MANPSWASVKRLVYERANGCCEYCQSCEYNTGQPMHIEHIQPNGDNDPQNLCLACASCNLSKATAISTRDPQTQQIIELFNPRNQIWHEHFSWIEGGLKLKALTATGRVTINRLKMNQPRLIRARS